MVDILVRHGAPCSERSATYAAGFRDEIVEYAVSQGAGYDEGAVFAKAGAEVCRKVGVREAEKAVGGCVRRWPFDEGLAEFAMGEGRPAVALGDIQSREAAEFVKKHGLPLGSLASPRSLDAIEVLAQELCRDGPYFVEHFSEVAAVLSARDIIERLRRGGVRVGDLRDSDGRSLEQILGL